MNYTVNKEWLYEQLHNPQVRIADCRFALSAPDKGEKLYKESHIPGAVYFDLDKQLSGSVEKHGGRHPLPDVKQFQAAIEKAGIDNTTTVIAYDDSDGQFAARFWWLLTYAGHEKVYVLDGGFKGWTGAGYSTTKEVPEYQPAMFEVTMQGDLLATYEEVKEIVDQKKKSPVLIDARDERRYLGEVEPIDRVAGHIPGAINKFWADGLVHGLFKGKGEQRKRFAELNPADPVIVYCGSGVTAAPNYIALRMAGFENVKLYAGSYSDWVSYEENPVAKGKES